MVKPVLRPALVLLALSACASSGAGDGEELARALAGRTSGEPRECVSAAPGTGLTILAPGALGYRDGDTLWVNRLAPACSGIRPMDILIAEVHDGRYCRGERVRAVAPGSSIARPACILGEFVRYRSGAG